MDHAVQSSKEPDGTPHSFAQHLAVTSIADEQIDIVRKLDVGALQPDGRDLRTLTRGDLAYGQADATGTADHQQTFSMQDRRH
jgi:hypothetical protein